jgi:hypothetical protein
MIVATEQQDAALPSLGTQVLVFVGLFPEIIGIAIRFGCGIDLSDGRSHSLMGTILILIQGLRKTIGRREKVGQPMSAVHVGALRYL